MTVHTSQDLTHGDLSAHLIRLAVPLIFGNILQEFYNTVDTFVVGRFAGQEEFAAIGIAGTVMNLFLFALVGCCTGFSVLFARAYGQNDTAELHHQEISALTVGMAAAFVLMLTGLAGMQPLLDLLQTPYELRYYISIYLKWIFISLPAAFLYNLFAAMLRSSGDTKAALAVLAAAVTANLVLDIIFVAIMSGGIEGAAAATALTQILSALICFIYMYRTHNELILHRSDLAVGPAQLKTSLRFGLVSSLHQCSLYLGKMFVQGAVNTAGTEVIAAYTAGTRIESFANSIGSSGSASTSVLTAQNYGAGRNDNVEQTFRCSLRLLALSGTLAGVIMITAAPKAIELLIGSNAGTAFSSGVGYLRFVALFYTVCFTGNTFTGYYNGTGRVMLPFIGALLHISIRVILSWLLFPYLGLNAVALATGIGWVCGNALWGFCKLRSGRGRDCIG